MPDNESPNESPPDDRLASAWRAATARVAACGVAQAAAAIMRARGSGFTPDQVIAIVGHFRAHAGGWRAGALWSRLAYGHPDTPPDQGWPPLDDAYIRSQKLHDAHTRDRTTQTTRTAASDRKAAERANTARLEAIHGPTIDALSRDQLESLVASIKGAEVVAAAVHWDRSKPFLRELLLAGLAEQSSPRTTEPQQAH